MKIVLAKVLCCASSVDGLFDAEADNHKREGKCNEKHGRKKKTTTEKNIIKKRKKETRTTNMHNKHSLSITDTTVQCVRLTKISKMKCACSKDVCFQQKSTCNVQVNKELELYVNLNLNFN